MPPLVVIHYWLGVCKSI